jgi:hypothetical protein
MSSPCCTEGSSLRDRMCWSVRTRARSAMVAVVLPLAFGGIARAEELKAPPIGRQLEYACKKERAYKRIYRVGSVDGDVVRYETTDGSGSYATKPLWLTGTTLYIEGHSGETTTKVTSGLEAFSGLRSLAVGSTFEGSIIEQDAHGKDVRSHVIVRVTEERSYQIAPFGPLAVLVIEQVWKTDAQLYSRTAYVSHEKSTTVYWKDKDPDGKIEECRLTALVDP